MGLPEKPAVLLKVSGLDPDDAERIGVPAFGLTRRHPAQTSQARQMFHSRGRE